MMLNLFDAGATLFIIDMGGVEVNPFMSYLIDISPSLFVTVKIVVFTIAIIIMAKFKPSHVRWVVGAYSLLALWHCYLLWNIYIFTLGQLMVI